MSDEQHPDAGTVVLDMAERRETWRRPAGAVDRIRDALPGGWRLAVVDAPVDGRADGGLDATPAALDAIAGAAVYLGFGVAADLLRAGGELRWVHTGTAGVSGSLTTELAERDVVFTNSAGVHGPPVAETALAMMLHFARGLDFAVRSQGRGEWDKTLFDTAPPVARELAGSTVGIVGYGGIGREVARRVDALGCRVLAVRRREAPAAGPAEVGHGPAALNRVLAESEYLVLAAPATPETEGIIDRAAIGRMRSDAVLVNVARGSLVDEDALVAALREDRLRGAALDVFATEPLPRRHPLWSLPNTLVTPHVSAYTTEYWRRETDLIVDNLERFFAGRPLRNVVNESVGY